MKRSIVCCAVFSCGFLAAVSVVAAQPYPCKNVRFIVPAAAGGTTTVIPFAAQQRGQSVRQVVEDYHKAAGPKAGRGVAIKALKTAKKDARNADVSTVVESLVA
mgnify:CR=1 FL=1